MIQWAAHVGSPSKFSEIVLRYSCGGHSTGWSSVRRSIGDTISAGSCRNRSEERVRWPMRPLPRGECRILAFWPRNSLLECRASPLGHTYTTITDLSLPALNWDVSRCERYACKNHQANEASSIAGLASLTGWFHGPGGRRLSLKAARVIAPSSEIAIQPRADSTALVRYDAGAVSA